MNRPIPQRDQAKTVAPEPMWVLQNQPQGAKTIQKVAGELTLEQQQK